MNRQGALPAGALPGDHPPRGPYFGSEFHTMTTDRVVSTAPVPASVTTTVKVASCPHTPGGV